MIRPRFLLLLLAFLMALPASAQNPVKWSATLQPAPIRGGEGGRIVVTGKIEAPWYIYAPTTPAGGPTATTIALLPSQSLVLSGKIAQPTPSSHFDEGFGMKTETFAKTVAFGLPIKIKVGASGVQKAVVQVRYQTCNARLCLPPKTVDVPLTFSVEAGAARVGKTAPDASVPPQAAQAAQAGVGGAPQKAGAAAPKAALKAATSTSGSTSGGAASRGLLAYAGVAFGAGLLALLTPCVFPMIPITVSFFTKRAEGKNQGLSGPVAYCAGIVGTFTVIGVAVSALFGASGISLFAANPWVNLALAALFTLLALNLFGAYEIMVPSSVLNRVQPNSNNKGGLLAPFLMGFAFTLTSFTCTVPFVGTALFAAASGGWLFPVVGMLCFSTAFALPFFLLALFPAWLSKLPRAGEWLISTKAFMGFLELAAALKFLSTVDLVWQLGWITRPVFLALWFALATGAALYLLRVLRLPKDSSDLKIGPFRVGLGFSMIGVATLLLGAMNGAKLGEFDAYLPPSDYGKNAVAGESKWLKNDLQAAQRLALSENKPLLINFTGYACTNCRLMENNVLPHPSVVRELDKFVAVELYTDGTDAKSQQFNRFQQQKFQTIAIPLYAVVDSDGTVRGKLEGLERDPQKFAAFLQANQNAPRVAARGVAGSATQ